MDLSAVTETKQSELIEEITPLVKLFQERAIRIHGTIGKPLFCATDVGKYIGDKNYDRRIQKYMPGKYMELLASTDTLERKCQMSYLTEAGLYKYLLHSKKKKAEEFQEFVYNFLVAERERHTVAVLEAAAKRELALKKINDDLTAGMSTLRDALECRNKLRRKGVQQIEKTFDLGCIYFIGKAQDSAAPTKIGYTKDLAKCFYALQTANSAELIIRRTILVTEPVEAEKRAHEYFRDWHCRGEWYNITQEAIHAYSDNWEPMEVPEPKLAESLADTDISDVLWEWSEAAMRTD